MGGRDLIIRRKRKIIQSGVERKRLKEEAEEGKTSENTYVYTYIRIYMYTYIHIRL
jgi:hypothetical protein